MHKRQNTASVCRHQNIQKMISRILAVAKYSIKKMKLKMSHREKENILVR